ncbi:unnamed protein product [Darwinula stevensoni]|uniref:PCI domain-containing protein n=1 Tax=Darwinula stevensoni TaxID=69355 RepID=A0A7R8XFB4_9CRUS|nr:unnamed protein product [Darwinula stevensoni]CAG0895124.1 unnamed protein product [Darwinula stevensoni]
MSVSEKSSAAPNPVEQFVLLAKGAKGAAAVELVKQAIEAPGVYVFGELLDMPNIKELAQGPHNGSWELLNLFAYGTYKDYRANQDSLPPVTPTMLQKLCHLTIVSLATKSKVLPYEMLLEELEMKNLRELEDVIIEAIYADVINGKLDQRNHQLEIHRAIGRDIRPEDIKEIASTLQDWCETCENMLYNVDSMISMANQEREKHIKHRNFVETQIQNLKKTMKTQREDSGENGVTDTVTPGEKKKPSSSTGSSMSNFKSKMVRGSNRLFNK